VCFTGGRWHCSFQVIVEGKARPAHARRSDYAMVGVDVGVKDLLVVASPDGVEVARIPAPKPLGRAQSRLRAAQRHAARRYGPYDAETKARREPSKRWQRANARVGRIHARVAAIRTQEIHQATTALATGHEVVAIEVLSAKNMSRRGGGRKRGLNRALGDAALGCIGTQLSYKSTWYGTELVTAPRFFPSTQLCSRCGMKTKLRLRDRTYRCRNGCPLIDRDLNAAINLARLGDPLVGERGPVPVVGRPPVLRLEMDVEPSGRPAPPTPRVRWGRQEAMKRQPRTLRGPLLCEEKLPKIASIQSSLLGNG
jgi:putative transposase